MILYSYDYQANLNLFPNSESGNSTAVNLTETQKEMSLQSNLMQKKIKMQKNEVRCEVYSANVAFKLHCGIPTIS